MAAKKTRAKRRVRRPASSSYARAERRVFSIDELEPAPYNARTITNAALSGLTASLQQLGVIAPPVVNVAGGKKRLVGGHQRVRALQEQGVEEVTCIVVEFDETQERQANVALNNPHIEGSFIPALTQALMHEISAMVDDAKVLTSLRLDALLRQSIRNAQHGEEDRQVVTGAVDDDEDVTLAKTAASSKLGEVYAIGNHRVYCGKLAGVGTLVTDLGIESAAMAISYLTAGARTMSDGFVDLHLGHMLANTSGGIYVACENRDLPQVHDRFQALGGHWSNTLFSYRMVASEAEVFALVYGWREGLSHAFYGGRDQGNLWPSLKPIRPGRMPVETVLRAILNSTRTGEWVLDPYAKHGDTLIAAEKSGRRLVGFCPTPRDMDRLRARWTLFARGKRVNWRTVTKVA